MPTDLTSRHTTELPDDARPLTGDALTDLGSQLSDRWDIVDEHHLEGEFEFDDFMGALAFTNRAGGVAETEGHHPEITLTWGKATVKMWTHSIDGLSENDFIVAARLDSVA